MTQACKDCKFSHNTDEKFSQILAEKAVYYVPLLQCRRFPPSTTPPRWPQVSERDWCGEYQR